MSGRLAHSGGGEGEIEMKTAPFFLLLFIPSPSFLLSPFDYALAYADGEVRGHGRPVREHADVQSF